MAVKSAHQIGSNRSSGRIVSLGILSVSHDNKLFQKLIVRGKMERRRLSMDNCAGDLLLATGVLRCSNKERYGSFLSRLAFSRIFMAACAIFSALPFDCGYFGLDFPCVNF